MIPHCFLCETPLRVWPDGGWRNWACEKCAGAHGLDKPMSQWPTWARKFCNAHEGTDRRREKQREAAGVEFVPLDDE